MSPAVPALKFALRAERRGVKIERGQWIKDEDRLARVPQQPAGFTAMEGEYAMIAQHAFRLNEFQIRAGFVDFLYSPDVIIPEEGK